jgi:hypothetical protein
MSDSPGRGRSAVGTAVGGHHDLELVGRVVGVQDVVEALLDVVAFVVGGDEDGDGRKVYVLRYSWSGVRPAQS